MTKLTESDIEQMTIEILQGRGYEYLYGPDIAPDGTTPLRSSLGEVVLRERLEAAVRRLNPSLPASVQDEAVKTVLRIGSTDLIADNERFHELLTQGVTVSVYENGEERGKKVWLVDFDDPWNNDFVVVNQFTVVENGHNLRPDVVLFVNGLPLVVMELKNAADEEATITAAYNQIETYKAQIPSLFVYNELIVISDGLEARAGSLSAGLSRYSAWKSEDGETVASHLVGELEVLLRGMLNKETLLDLVRSFTVFEKDKHEDKATGQLTITTVKKVAAYHQYYAVNKAVESTLRATGINSAVPEAAESPENFGFKTVKEQQTGDHRAGVVWHTQGSGKSLSMVFYTGKIVQRLNNPTVVVITDRNDLDDQLFETFVASKQLLRQTPVQADSCDHLKHLLQVQSGGVVFTTIQKFQPEEGNRYDLLTNRTNVVVIADEAHRTQYGFGAKTREVRNEADEVVGSEIKYGFAKYLRDALPNATYIGFTGTPIELSDKNTPAVFGNYIDVYDIAQAVEDGATVRIYYESRLAKVELSAEGRKLVEELDKELDVKEMDEVQKAKAKWTQLEALIGSPNRVKNIARDIVEHFEARQQVFEGKAMVVAMSRRIAVELYDEIVKLRPEWHNDDLRKGALKVVMTSAASDGPAIAKHHTTKTERRMLADRMKDPDDELKLVIVRDMWLTGFDVPCLHTLYIDKPMQGHNLMQAIARVNRVFQNKEGGLIVDYVGIARALKQAMFDYTGRDRANYGDMDIGTRAYPKFQEKLEVCQNLFHGFDYSRFITGSDLERAHLITGGVNFISDAHEEKRKENFIKESMMLRQALSLCRSIVPPDQRLEAAFFEAVRTMVTRISGGGKKLSLKEINERINELLKQSIKSQGVINLFADVKKEFSLFDPNFLEEIARMKEKNLAIELLKKLIAEQVSVYRRSNVVKSEKFSEMLQRAMHAYLNGC